ncbi:MAG: carboxylesterase family protein, partial [Candidatus Lokiarchaeota archaeon]|nr:carboxylesterase family protein [Candidatus Lokiarchaeota archaeon]
MKKSTIINTLSGRVQGFIKDGITIFKGISYASPPIDALRFQPPQVHKGWECILKATEFGPYAPQGFTLLEEMFGHFENQNEDNCLSLNIWTPETDNESRPVMVYIHGGSFIFGGGADIWYGVDGTQLARKGNVVVVTLNYRLGAFGFLYIEDQIANIGILDQIAALKWIKKNIEKFGGNPNNITIFGESAGALSALILTSIPLTKGLFHRAIIQSAPIMDTKPTIKSNTKLFQELGIKNGDISAL